ncbi:hypothetical protein OJF2_68510 [Aquisphaera giovannonii]|uniref:Uncharacterized protein n=1 Tax=Aquisphaera giovannonii TaxID=406548 RepID=A0A5B9WCN5_9BACT|nr:hypothetical protein [Aquisphaera giovannonii]QEH38253.1 hypothetical protein OJF2_68510 [Aquisphaera giovannonii]
MIGLKRVIGYLKGHDSYELRARTILRRIGPFHKETLPVDDIETWTCYPEMIFDVVEVRLKDGNTVTWLDYKNDLLAILNGLDLSGKDAGIADNDDPTQDS